MSGTFVIVLLLIEVYLIFLILRLSIKWIMVTLWTNYKDEVIDAYLKYEMMCQRRLVKKYNNSHIFFRGAEDYKKYLFIPQSNLEFGVVARLLFNKPILFSLLLIKRPTKCQINSMLFYKQNFRHQICLFGDYVLNNRRLRPFYKLASLMDEYQYNNSDLVSSGAYREYNVSDFKHWLGRLIGERAVIKLIILTKFKIILDFIYWCLIEKNVILQKLNKTKKSWK